MEIQELWRVVAQRWRVVVITTLVCVLLALSWSFGGPVSYKAQDRVTISASGSLGTAGDAYSGEQVSIQRAPTYVQLLNGPEVAKRAAAKLNGEISAQTIQDSVKAQITAKLPMIVVTATSRSANDAVRMVAAAEQGLQGYVKEIERPGRDGSLTSVVLSGSAPTVVRDGNPLRDSILAGLFGLLLGIILATFRDRTDPVVKGAGQIVKEGFTYRGTVSVGVEQSVVDEAMRRIAVELVLSDADGASRVLVAGVDRECDTTFVARELGRALARCGRAVTVVDGVRPSDASKAQGLTDVLAGVVDWRTCAVKTRHHKVSKMSAGNLAVPVDALVIDGGDVKTRFPLSGAREHIVFASPSIVHSPVAVALTAVADSVLIVVRQGRSTVADVAEAKLAVNALGIHAIGMVLIEGEPPARGAPKTTPDDHGARDLNGASRSNGAGQLNGASRSNGASHLNGASRSNGASHSNGAGNLDDSSAVIGEQTRV